VNEFSVWPLTETSQLGEIRRFVNNLTREIGFNEVEMGRAAIVVTEAATNLLKHGKGGELLVRPIYREAGQRAGLEIMALDKGPGIFNLEQAFVDGYSTAGSLGTGLGAIARLVSNFDIYSHPKLGTALLANLRLKVETETADVVTDFETGAVCLPKPGETECGDAWAAYPNADGFQVMVVDGLGHGPLAAETAQTAMKVFREQPLLEPGALIQACHLAMPQTRGAALAVARINKREAKVTFAGIGNIAGYVWSANGQRNMVSHNGIVGHQIHRVQEFTYPWAADDLLVMTSDGINTHFKPEAYPGLARHQPDLIAGVLYRDFRRERDDTTAVVARERHASSEN